MKTLRKYLLCLVFLFTIVAIPVRASTTNEVYISSLRQVIALLQQQVAVLIEQLKLVVESQKALTTSIQNNTVNSTPNISFGSTTPMQPENQNDPIIQQPDPQSTFTVSELKKIFNGNLPFSANVISSTSVTLDLQGIGGSKGDIQFNGQIVLTKDGNELESHMDGQVYSIHTRTWVAINDLTPDTTYHYQYIYHGSPNRVTDFTFKTLKSPL